MLPPVSCTRFPRLCTIRLQTPASVALWFALVRLRSSRFPDWIGEFSRIPRGKLRVLGVSPSPLRKPQTLVRTPFSFAFGFRVRLAFSVRYVSFFSFFVVFSLSLYVSSAFITVSPYFFLAMKFFGEKKWGLKNCAAARFLQGLYVQSRYPHCIVL